MIELIKGYGNYPLGRETHLPFTTAPFVLFSNEK